MAQNCVADISSESRGDINIATQRTREVSVQMESPGATGFGDNRLSENESLEKPKDRSSGSETQFIAGRRLSLLFRAAAVGGDPCRIALLKRAPKQSRSLDEHIDLRLPAVFRV